MSKKVEFMVGESLDPEVLKLTPRQFDNIDLASRGMTTQEIGEALGISDKTVKNERALLIARFAARNMAHVVRIACVNELLDEPLKLDNVGWLSPALLVELELASLGLGRSEAALVRQVSAKTVANQRRAIYEALDVYNICHAVRVGFQTGFLPLASGPTFDI